MKIIHIFYFLFFSGCGYLPISYYAEQSIGKSVYVDAKINLADPENSVIAKDALNQAIVNRFQSNLTTKEKATTIISIELSNIDIYSIADDENGFSIFYRASVIMQFSYKDKKGNIKHFSNSGSYDFSSESISTITEDKRFDALSKACMRAIDRFIAQVASNWR